MQKINLNPEFTADDTAAVPTKNTGVDTVEGVKEQEETLEESEKTDTDSPEDNKTTDSKSTEEKTEEIKKDKSTSEPDKLAALEALRKQEIELDKDTSELDKEIIARRERIVQKRTERREKKDLIETIGSKLPDTEEDRLEDIDSTTLAILDRYTKAKGLVPKSELKEMSYESTHKTAESAFYEKHKEYLPENDSNDILYGALKRELALFAKPSDPALISKLFEKAHSEVKKQYPQFFKETTLTDKVNASQRTSTASMGGGNTGGSSRQPKSEGKTLSAIQIQALRQGGWTEEEIAGLNK